MPPMVGRLFERLLARFGYGIVTLQAQAAERQTAAAAIADLEAALAAARRDGERLKATSARLREAHAGEVSRMTAEMEGLWARLGKTRADRDLAAGRAAELAAQLSAEAEANTAIQARLWSRIEVQRSEIEALRGEAEAARAELASRVSKDAEANAAAQARLWSRIEVQRSEIEALRGEAEAARAELASRVSEEAEASAVAQARLWSRIEVLRGEVEEAREARAELAGRVSQDAEANAAAQARLWERIEALRAEAVAARTQLQEAQAREVELGRGRAAEAEKHAALVTRLRGRLDRERGRVAAATAAEAAERKAARTLERRVAAAQRDLVKTQTKLDTIRAARAESLKQIGMLNKRLAKAAGDQTLAKLTLKLDRERARADSVKQKLDSEQKRARRLAAERKTLAAQARSYRLEADRALGQEQKVLAELIMAGERPALGSAPGDASDRGVEWLAKTRGPRLGAAAEAAEQFRLGRSFQTQGAIGLAGACFRRVGPYMQDLLAQEGPDGDRVTGPDFLIIGAARAGTTWLKKCLAHHPQVFILAGEHHYFSTSSHLPPETYVGRFANAYSRFQRPGAKVKLGARHSQRLYGEKSTTYLAMPQAQIDLCAALFPQARLICLVRDPAARVWSHLKHLKMRDALQRIDRLADLPPWMEVDELIRQGRYEEHLLHWARRFDPGQMLLVDFERIAREPDAVHAEVLAHIGAAPAPAPQVLDDSNRTDQAQMPSVLADRLSAAFEGERFDIPYLRAAMERAAEAQRGGVRARRGAVRLAGSPAA